MKVEKIEEAAVLVERYYELKRLLKKVEGSEDIHHLITLCEQGNYLTFIPAVDTLKEALKKEIESALKNVESEIEVL